jgi:hypothetical protein
VFFRPAAESSKRAVKHVRAGGSFRRKRESRPQAVVPAGNAGNNGAISLLARSDSSNVCAGAAPSPAMLVAGVSSVPSNRAASPSPARQAHSAGQGWLIGVAFFLLALSGQAHPLAKPRACHSMAEARVAAVSL